MTDIDLIDYEYFVEKTAEYKAMRAKLRELVASWTTLANEMDTFALDDAAEAAGISKCISELEALLEVK